LSQIPIGEQFLKYPLGYDTITHNLKQLPIAKKDEISQVFSFYQLQNKSSKIRNWIGKLRSFSEKRELRQDVIDPALFEAQEIARDLVMLLNTSQNQQ